MGDIHDTCPRLTPRDRIRLTLCGTAAVIRRVLLRAGSIAETTAKDTAADALERSTVNRAAAARENARDVPISLTVFNAAAIEQREFFRASRATSRRPERQFHVPRVRATASQLSLRGVSDQLQCRQQHQEGSFGFYIDEFNVAQGHVHPEIVDIDRIEVLRGPQGTYFGRNSVGGAINITTKQPTNEFFAEASAQYSSFNTVDSHIHLEPARHRTMCWRSASSDAMQPATGNIKNINLIGGGNNSK